MNSRKLLLQAAALSISSLYEVTTVFAQSGPTDRWHHGPGMMWGYGGGFGMFFGFLFMVLILAAVIVGAFLLLRALGFVGNTADSIANSDRALDILKERFAKGEIDAKEFDERKRHLSD